MDDDIISGFEELNAQATDLAPEQATILRKIKIFQKATSILAQQVDRFCHLFNRNMDKVKLGKFKFNNEDYKDRIQNSLATIN